MNTKAPSQSLTTLYRRARYAGLATIAVLAAGCASAPRTSPATAASTPAPTVQQPAADAQMQPPAPDRTGDGASPSPTLLSYESLKSSDFYQFFHLRPIDTMDAEGGLRIVRLKPGAFTDSIEVIVVLDKADAVRGAHLALARRWVGDADHVNALSTDIAASFLRAFAGARDREQVGGLAAALRDAHGTSDQALSLRAHTPAPRSPVAVELIRAFEGVTPVFHQALRDIEISAENSTKPPVPFIDIMITVGHPSPS